MPAVAPRPAARHHGGVAGDAQGWSEHESDERVRFVVRSAPPLRSIGWGAANIAAGVISLGSASRYVLVGVMAGSVQIARAVRRVRPLVVELDRQLLIASRGGHEALRAPLDAVVGFRAGRWLPAPAWPQRRRRLAFPPAPDWTVFVVAEGGGERPLDVALDGEATAAALASRLDAVRRRLRTPRGYRG